MLPRLYSGPLSMFGAKAEIALHEKGVPFDLVMVPFDMERLYEPKHPEVARINPKGQVPVLVDGGLELFDSTQIFEYLEDRWPSPPLWPEDPADRARARQLEHLSDEVYFPPVVRLMGLQAAPHDPAAVAARASCAAFYRRMETTLGDAEWLAGRYSYADIAFFMAQLFGARMGAPITDVTPALLRWRSRMAARPAVRRVAAAMGRYLLSVDRPLPPFLEEAVQNDASICRSGGAKRQPRASRHTVYRAATKPPASFAYQPIHDFWQELSKLGPTSIEAFYRHMLSIGWQRPSGRALTLAVTQTDLVSMAKNGFAERVQG